MAGVGLVINAGTDVESIGAGIALAGRHAMVRFAAGLHPETLDEKPAEYFGPAKKAVEEALAHRSCVAVGEIGLDYHHNKENKKEQTALFEEQCEMALRHSMPVIIHAREAWDDTFAILQRYKGRLTGIFHCFSGGEAEVKRSLDLGFFISFAGNLTYPTAGLLREAALYAPCDRTFLETDAPFLTPVPMRGKRNEPAFVAHTYGFYASLKETGIDKLAETHEKALRGLMRIG